MEKLNTFNIPNFKSENELKNWILENEVHVLVGPEKRSMIARWEETDPIHREPWSSFRSMLKWLLYDEDFISEQNHSCKKEYHYLIEDRIKEETAKGLNRFMKEWIEFTSNSPNGGDMIMKIKSVAVNKSLVISEELKKISKKSKKFSK